MRAPPKKKTESKTCAWPPLTVVGSIHEGSAQIELDPCWPKQVILVTESGSRLAEH
jgi:hypothetical protein